MPVQRSRRAAKTLRELFGALPNNGGDLPGCCVGLFDAVDHVEDHPYEFLRSLLDERRVQADLLGESLEVCRSDTVRPARTSDAHRHARSQHWIGDRADEVVQRR